VQVLVLEPLGEEALRSILRRAVGDVEFGLGARGLVLTDDGERALLALAQGDARALLNFLELAALLAASRETTSLTGETVREAAGRRAILYDKAGEEHYNVVSAFIKSMRGSDPDAALYWLARMVEAGEDPEFVARRLVIFASEDVGNADPGALALAVACKDAVRFVGMPEGFYPLSQATVYLACAPKSNAAGAAYQAALEQVRAHGALPVPLHLRNAPTPLLREQGYGRGYRYPHDHEDGWVDEDYLPEALTGSRFYRPTDRGREREIGDRLGELRSRRGGRD
jgi:putative ATPase